MVTRTAEIRSSINATNRSIEAVLSTDRPVEMWDARNRQTIDEVLLTGGAVIPSQVPLLDAHNRGAVSDVLGSVKDIRPVGGSLVGRLYFARTAAAEDAWQLAQDGHLTDVSVGYRIRDFVEIPAGRSQIVNGRQWTAESRPLRVVTRWTLQELSLVPIGADSAAKLSRHGELEMSATRSAPRVVTPSATATANDAQRILDIARTNAGVENYSSLKQEHIARAICEYKRIQVHSASEATRMSMSVPEGAATHQAIVHHAIEQGAREVVDSTLGWTLRQPADDYREHHVSTTSVLPRLSQVPRGDTAGGSGTVLKTESGYVVRFGVQFKQDEQDLLDTRTLGLQMVAVVELGRAAKRLIPDLVYSVLLANDVLAADGVALFDASRGNAGTAALSNTALNAAAAVIGNQVLPDEFQRNVHLNLPPTHLIVPPDLDGTARELLRDRSIGDGDLQLRSDSRIGTNSLLDPRDEKTTHTGTATNWFLAADPDVRPGIIVRTLGGRDTPLVRSFELDGGQWGLGFDVQFSVGVTVADAMGLYRSTGAA